MHPLPPPSALVQAGACHSLLKGFCLQFLLSLSVLHPRVMLPSENSTPHPKLSPLSLLFPADPAGSVSKSLSVSSAAVSLAVKARAAHVECLGLVPSLDSGLLLTHPPGDSSDGSSRWVPATHMRVLDCIPGSCLPPAIAGIWQVNQQMGAFSRGHFSLSAPSLPLQ